MRENTSPGLEFPQWVNGRQLWVAPEVRDIIRKLHEGDPTLGWEGDPRLALYHDNEKWLLYRCEADEEMRLLCQSKPGVELNDGLIRKLVEHDTRRGFNPVAAVDKHNATLGVQMPDTE